MVSDGATSIIIVGSGGREHALGWKLGKGSSGARKIYFAPGNGGTFENLPIGQTELERIANAAARLNAVTIVGPEEPLSLGIVDLFNTRGLKIFGPTKAAAKLEASKAFSKQFMLDFQIPTAEGQAFEDVERARDYVRKCNWPLVAKADGLAAGKGVIVCDGQDDALDAVERIMVKKEFGHAGDKIVIEKRIFGDEASFIAICDGRNSMPLASSQDHKRILDGDRGPNTGGMGAYSPTVVISPELTEQISERVIKPAVSGMRSRGSPFVGFLYAGVMIERDTGRPFVLEFNARMGDPECQPIMMRMDSDLYSYIEAAVEQRLDSMPEFQWKEETAVCVIMASRGYPGAYSKGKVIEGLGADFGSETMVFHAGTARDQKGNIVTNGGRVLGVTSLGRSPRQAFENAYSAVRKIRWGDNDHYYRTDIGRRAMS